MKKNSCWIDLGSELKGLSWRICLDSLYAALEGGEFTSKGPFSWNPMSTILITFRYSLAGHAFRMQHRPLCVCFMLLLISLHLDNFNCGYNTFWLPTSIILPHPSPTETFLCPQNAPPSTPQSCLHYLHDFWNFFFVVVVDPLSLIRVVCTCMDRRLFTGV